MLVIRKKNNVNVIALFGQPTSTALHIVRTVLDIVRTKKAVTSLSPMCILQLALSILIFMFIHYT